MVVYSGGFKGAHPPYGPKFSQIHAVFRKIWQNHMLVPPPQGWLPLLRGILDPPLVYELFLRFSQNFLSKAQQNIYFSGCDDHALHRKRRDASGLYFWKTFIP